MNGGNVCKWPLVCLIISRNKRHLYSRLSKAHINKDNNSVSNEDLESLAGCDPKV